MADACDPLEGQLLFNKDELFIHASTIDVNKKC
jgi:hypothetical protein